MTRHPVRSWLPWYLVLALIWGNSFVFIKLGLQSLTPAGVVLSRLFLGAITMLVISAVLRSPLPSRRHWRPMFVAAALMTSAGWVLFAFSEQYVSSAFAGIMNGATPLLTLVVIMIAFPEEHPTPQRVVGLVVGFLGVLVVVGVWQGLGGATLVGFVACALAVTGYGIAYPYVRRHLATGSEALGPMTFATGLMVMGTLQIAPVAAITGFSHAPITSSVVLAMVALGVLGSGIAYILNLRVVTDTDSTTASTVTYVIPLVAVVAGAVLLGEPLTWSEGVGGAIVLLGAAIAQGLLPLRRRAAKSES